MADIQTATVAPAHVLEAALRQLVTVITGEIGDRDLIAAAVLATTEAEKLKAEARKAPRFDLTVNQMRQAIEFATGGFTPDTEDELETSLTFCVGPLQMDEAGTNIQECTHCWLTDLAEEGAIPLDEYPTAQDLAKAQAPAASEQDARHIAIGKAIERACADQPEDTEIIISLERGAGSVSMLDPDGNEHDYFQCDDGFAGVVNQAIDAAIAAQAAQQGGAA